MSTNNVNCVASIQQRFVYVFFPSPKTRTMHPAPQRFTIFMRNENTYIVIARPFCILLSGGQFLVICGKRSLQLARGGGGGSCTIDFPTVLYDGNGGGKRVERETPAAASVVAAKGPRRRRSVRLRRYNRTR